MVKPGALLLLLAVAASQVDLSLAQTFISTCAINFYGRSCTWVQVVFNSDSTFSICFLETETETPTECLLFSETEGATTFTITVVSDPTEAGSLLHDALPSITGNSTCYVTIVMETPVTSNYFINVYPFTDQVAVEVAPEFAPDDYLIQAMLGEVVVKEFTPQPSTTSYVDVSACRQYDFPVFPSTSKLFEDTCETASCDLVLTLDVESTCVGYEVCQGSDTCIIPTVVCTVTGSTVIDFNNNTHTITNLCGYDLAYPTQGDNLLEVIFRERRRKDVPLVEELVLYVDSANEYVHLKQGGRVEDENGGVLTFSTSPMAFHGVDFFLDNGVISFTMLDSGMVVSFDGNTIHVSGLFQPSSYLCGDPTNPSVTTTPEEQKDYFYDSGHCDIVYDDDTDSMIDLTEVTAACTAFRNAPFAACNDFIDPEPYETACTTTMTVYPDVDGLFCQFYEAYAVSCNLRNGISLEGWQAATDCAVVLQHSCRDQICSSHEFCGEMLGHTRCLCRALYAADYISTDNTLGEPIVCEDNTATLTLAACLLWKDGIDPLSLHLNDPTCTGDLNEETNMITFSFGSSTCDTILTMQDTDLVFQNTIMTSTTGDITRDDDVAIDFSCYYVQPDSRTVNFFIADGSVMLQVDSDEWNYTLQMRAYYDPGRYRLIEPGSPLSLDQRIWLGLTAEGLDDRVDVVIDSCWATNGESVDVLQHDLIVDGCPDDLTVIMEENGLGHSVYFSVIMFEFYDVDNEVNLHCQVSLCPSDPGCAPDCSGAGRRKRRSSSSEFANGSQTLITMTWRK